MTVFCIWTSADTVGAAIKLSCMLLSRGHMRIWKHWLCAVHIREFGVDPSPASWHLDLIRAYVHRLQMGESTHAVLFTTCMIMR